MGSFLWESPRNGQIWGLRGSFHPKTGVLVVFSDLGETLCGPVPLSGGLEAGLGAVGGRKLVKIVF